MTWNPSPDPSVTGYNIYYGTASHDYTSMIPVGNVAGTVIDNLSENTTYFFAAKAHDAAGNESEFSNEATYSSQVVKINASQNLLLQTMPAALTDDQVTFSLASGAPDGVSINSTNGALSWNTCQANANTTNSISVIITDLTNPSASTQINLLVQVSDYLGLTLASVPVQAGQGASLPVTLSASDGVTDVTFTMNWSGDRLLNPALTLVAPVAGGSLLNQGTNLVIHLWTANGDVLTGNNQIAQVIFQAAANQSSAVLSLPVSAVVGIKLDGSAFANIIAEPAEVVISDANFSNEATCSNQVVKINASQNLLLQTMPAALMDDQITFSLASGAPDGASINSTNGALSWNTCQADANTTNSISVIITDLTNPNASTQINLLVQVSDYLGLTLASVPVQAGQGASLPVTLSASDGVTDVTFTMNWSGDRLLNPALTIVAPVAGGSLLNQGTNLVIHLWTANGDVLTGNNQIAQVNFQAAANQPSAFFNLPVSAIAGVKLDGSAFSNIIAEPAEVVIVGANPLLRPNASASQGRTLTLYANPGTDYQLQYATDLAASAPWQPLLDYQPTNLEQTITLDSANPVVFYRLMQN